MKYTTKSGLELPPEVVEVIEHEQAMQGGYNGFFSTTFGFNWNDSSGKIEWYDIYNGDFTEFYKLYPKKDLDSYGNEIHKGEMVYVADYKNMLDNDREPQEFICIAEKSKEKYIAYTPDYAMATSYKFCLKISSTEVKKSELQSQMEDLKAQVKEIEAKINEL